MKCIMYRIMCDLIKLELDYDRKLIGQIFSDPKTSRFPQVCEFSFSARFIKFSDVRCQKTAKIHVVDSLQSGAPHTPPGRLGAKYNRPIWLNEVFLLVGPHWLCWLLYHSIQTICN